MADDLDSQNPTPYVPNSVPQEMPQFGQKKRDTEPFGEKNRT
jgi:hypothetical protein